MVLFLANKDDKNVDVVDEHADDVIGTEAVSCIVADADIHADVVAQLPTSQHPVSWKARCRETSSSLASRFSALFTCYDQNVSSGSTISPKSTGLMWDLGESAHFEVSGEVHPGVCSSFLRRCIVKLLNWMLELWSSLPMPHPWSGSPTQ